MSKGIRRLAEAASKYGQVWVIAPDGQRSAMSHSYSFHTSVKMSEYDFDMPGVTAYSCTGTPTDCIRVGIIKIMPEKPDLVLTGINNGYNMCWDIQYSATVGSAMEAAFMGIPAIAFSHGDENKSQVTEKYLDQILENLIEKINKSALEKHQIWSVNFPMCALEDCKGIMWDTKVSLDNFYNDDYSEKILENGDREYEVVVGRNWEAAPGTDLYAIVNNYVSVGIVNNYN